MVTTYIRVFKKVVSMLNVLKMKHVCGAPKVGDLCAEKYQWHHRLVLKFESTFFPFVLTSKSLWFFNPSCWQVYGQQVFECFTQTIMSLFVFYWIGQIWPLSSNHPPTHTHRYSIIPCIYDWPSHCSFCHIAPLFVISALKCSISHTMTPNHT